MAKSVGHATLVASCPVSASDFFLDDSSTNCLHLSLIPAMYAKLENAILRGIHLTRGDQINVEDLGLSPARPVHRFW